MKVKLLTNWTYSPVDLFPGSTGVVLQQTALGATVDFGSCQVTIPWQHLEAIT